MKKAVALSYKKEKPEVPRVVAKGTDDVAEKILDIARAHQVPLYEDRALLQKVYSLKVGESIPEELYQAVAVLLAWVYSLDKKEAR